MTTDSEMFADMSTSRMIVGSGMRIAIRIMMIAIGIAICVFMAPSLMQPPCHPARIAYPLR